MSKTNITAHLVVKNEDMFIWYAISSIINFTDRIIIFDTGSQDRTEMIIKTFKSDKIVFAQKGEVNSQELTNLRQEQVEMTRTDWCWIVDGDEIYPKSTAREIIKYVGKKDKRYEGGVVRRYDLLGDIYHYQRESVGEYNLFGQRGHLVLRLINKRRIPLLNARGIYPYEGYFDSQGKPLIKHRKENFFITRHHLFHAMYLPRSTLGSNLDKTLHRHKYKIETGYPFKSKKEFPEVFYLHRPNLVPDVSRPRNISYEIQASIITPLKQLKRKIWRFMNN